MAGIWITPGQYMEFSESPDRSALSREIAIRGRTWEWADLMGLLPDPDPVLKKMGGGVEILESLTADPHLISVVQTRKLGTTARAWRWKAGGNADGKPNAAAVDLVRRLAADLERVDMEGVISQILDAPLYGFVPIEILWEPEGGRVRIKDLRPLPCRWFGFSSEGEPKFKSLDNPFDGEALPFGKFVFARHLNSYANPYGVRLLSRCFWPVAIKRGGLQWWATLAEKYGMPFLVGEYPAGTTKEDRRAMLSDLMAMVQDAVAVIPAGGKVTLLEQRSGGSTVYEKLYAAMDAAMSKAVMGQTLTAEIGDKGSYAAGRVHENVLELYREADLKLVRTVMEEVAWLYGLVNAPDVPAPEWVWVEDEDLRADRADRDLKVTQISGLKLSEDYLVREYGYQKGDLVAPDKPAGPGAEFAEGEDAARAPDLAGHQAGIDDQVETCTTQGVAALAANERRFPDLVRGAKSYPEAKEKILAAFPDLDVSGLEDILARGLLAANLYGHWSAARDAEFAEGPTAQALNLPMSEALDYWRDKVKLRPSEFAALSEAAKVKAFAVSGIAREAELATVYDALQRALADGISFKEFSADCEEIFSRRNFGERRIKTIFETNIQTAYNVGRYKQMQRTAQDRPYAQYDAVNDRRTRPTHAAMDGKVYPLDHEFWDTWWPPNGFRCRCGVISLSERDVRRQGLTVETRDITGRLIEPVDPVTGAKQPARLLMPDPGFAHHPGKVQWGDRGGVDEGGFKPMPDLPGPADYKRPKIANIKKADLPALDAGRLLPAGRSDDFYSKEFEARYGQAKVLKDPSGQPVVLTNRLFLAKKDGAPVWKFGKAGHGECIPLLEEMITDPYEVWLTPYQRESGRVALGRTLISVWKGPDQRVGGYALFEVVDGEAVGITAFLPTKGGKLDIRYLENQRKGLLLYGRK